MKNCASATIVPNKADRDEIEQNARNILDKLSESGAHEITYSAFTGEDGFLFSGGMDALISFIHPPDDR